MYYTWNSRALGGAKCQKVLRREMATRRAPKTLTSKNLVQLQGRKKNVAAQDVDKPVEQYRTVFVLHKYGGSKDLMEHNS